MRNPTWNREELILALELYFRLEYSKMDGRHPEVIALSQLLTQMNSANGFERSVNSVSLKLANFKRIDPDLKGEGMKAGSKLEEDVWDEFVDAKNDLIKVASKIKNDVIRIFISRKKQQFITWLTKAGKIDGSEYQIRTIHIYASQVEKSIFKEFSLDGEYQMGLFEINDLKVLQQIEFKLSQGEDNKKRRDLRSAFHNYVRFVRDQYELNDQTQLPDEFYSKTEGGKKVYISQRTERDVKLRNKAIAIHGTACKACGFDFRQNYGKWGEDYIEVHHLVQLGGKESMERETDPVKDLTVLCSNCHRMIHRKQKIVLSLEELKCKIKATTAK